MRTKAQDRDRKRRERLNDPATARAKDAEYRRLHPERMLLKRARVRASKLKLHFDLNETDIAVPANCPILGIELRVVQGEGKRPHDCSPSLDRIDPNKGYVRDNVAVISQRANRIKNNATRDELAALLAWMESM